MSDFHSSSLATLHWLRSSSAELEVQLQFRAQRQPVSLILPCHARDLHAAALQRMVEQLRHLPWLSRVILGLDQATAEDNDFARRLFAPLPQAEVFWLDGPDGRQIQDRLAAAGHPTNLPGKGRNVWLCLGRLLASTHSGIIAVHDCDILTYNAEFLSRLVLPLMQPDWGFRFAKGYYARFSDRLHGRLTRLFFWPLLVALRNQFPTAPMLSALSEFRYPLAGEVAFDVPFARELRIPSGWSLEAVVLAQAHQLLPAEQICQAGLCPAYDHKHQSIPSSGHSGLAGAAVEIAAALHNFVPGADLVAAQAEFISQAKRAVIAAERDALANGLHFDRAEEEAAVVAFAKALAEGFQLPPPPLLPSWSDLAAQLPALFPPP